MIDITDKIGRLYPRKGEPAWPMYSCDRPAYMLWNAIANALHEHGFSQMQIKDWLQSKETRWALDGELGSAIEKIGKEYADTLVLQKGGNHGDS